MFTAPLLKAATRTIATSNAGSRGHAVAIPGTQARVLEDGSFREPVLTRDGLRQFHWTEGDQGVQGALERVPLLAKRELLKDEGIQKGLAQLQGRKDVHLQAPYGRMVRDRETLEEDLVAQKAAPGETRLPVTLSQNRGAGHTREVFAIDPMHPEKVQMHFIGRHGAPGTMTLDARALLNALEVGTPLGGVTIPASGKELFIIESESRHSPLREGSSVRITHHDGSTSYLSGRDLFKLKDLLKETVNPGTGQADRRFWEVVADL